MNVPLDPSMLPLESAEEEVTLDSQLFTAFKRKKQQQKWLVTNLAFSNKLDVLYADFIVRLSCC